MKAMIGAYRADSEQKGPYRRPTEGWHSEHGFSLIEMMSSVTIGLLVLLVALPSISNVSNYKLTGQARSIASELAQARMRAASGGTKTRVNFGIAAGTYQIEVWSSSAAAYQVEGGVQTLQTGITFGFGAITTAAGQQTTIAQTTPIYFNSRGICTVSLGNPIATSAIYIGNTSGGYAAVAASIAGQPSSYTYQNSAWAAY